MTMENSVVTMLTEADVVKEIIPEYVHTKTHNHSRVVILKIRFIKEAKGTKPEDSVGFAKFSNHIKAVIKNTHGVKCFYSPWVVQYKRDGSGNFVRDEYGDRVKKTVGGWLLETAQDGSFNEALAEEAKKTFVTELLKGLNNNEYKLEPPKAPKTTDGKPKKPSKNDLELEIIRLKKALAEAQAQH